jgi:dienelactone hydrolase
VAPDGTQTAVAAPDAVRGEPLVKGVRVAAVALAATLSTPVLATGVAPTRARAASGGAGVTGEAIRAGFAVGVRVLRYVDASRLARPRGSRAVPRTLPVVLRYPAASGEPTEHDLFDAAPERSRGPLPLVVFAHGFATTPAIYARLLRAWARAGYVVAAPVFPLERADAPGGPDESDLVNEPGDISFVISRLLAASAKPGSPLSGLIDPARIAVAGQSDGAIAALAAAYATRLRDRRVRAAIVMSGAETSGIGGYSFGAGTPALLAMQGTADTSNAPRYTYAYFEAAARPKYLLRLLGAGHLPPYTSEQPQLGIVERTSIAFLDDYLREEGGAGARLAGVAASAQGVATLTTRP